MPNYQIPMSKEAPVSRRQMLSEIQSRRLRFEIWDLKFWISLDIEIWALGFAPHVFHH